MFVNFDVFSVEVEQPVARPLSPMLSSVTIVVRMGLIFNGNAKAKCPSSSNLAKFKYHVRDMIILMILIFWPGHVD